MSSDPLEALLAAGEPAFLDELAVEIDAERLGRLALRWYGDDRPESRQLLLAYLAQPLNPFHEPLVLSLFEQACKAGDDAVMAAFLVLADRCLRHEPCAEGNLVIAVGEAIGESYAVQTGQGMRVLRLTADQRRDYQTHRLFDVLSRLPLRRQAWHYFDRLGQMDPPRYVEAITQALMLYTDRDAPSGTEGVLENWCLCHVLFHHGALLHADDSGQRWRREVPWYGGADVPAPAHECAWSAAPQALLHLLARAPCQMIRHWAGRVLAWQSPAVLRRLPEAELFSLLSSDSLDIAHVVEETLQARGDLERISADTWLAMLLARGGKAPAFTRLCLRYLSPERVTAEQAIRIASSETPVAGFAWQRYVKHHLEGGEVPADLLLRLLDSPQKELRWEMALDVARALRLRESVERGWVLAFLEHRCRNVRDVGWSWFREDEDWRDDVDLWRRLAASPHAEVRAKVHAWLDERQYGWPPALRDGLALDDEALHVLWARVLLTLHGTWRRTAHRLAWQLVTRLQARPDDHVHLLPMLGEVLRHAAGPAWREALTGVVRLVEEHPDWQPLVAAAMPELQLAPASP